LASGDIDAVGVVRIEADGDYAEVLELVVQAADLVVERDPAVVRGEVHAVNAADVGAGIDQACSVEWKTVRSQATAAHGRVAPSVCL